MAFVVRGAGRPNPLTSGILRGATRPKSPCGYFSPPLPSGNFFFLAKRNCRKKRAPAAQHNVTLSVAQTANSAPEEISHLNLVFARSAIINHKTLPFQSALAINIIMQFAGDNFYVNVTDSTNAL